MSDIKRKDYIVKQLDDMKIEDILVIDASKTSSLADWVIIGNGRSGKHIESSIENLRAKMKQDGMYEGKINGTSEDGWVVYDVGNIIVHLFVPEVREIYKLEDLFNPKIKKVTSDEKVVKKTETTKVIQRKSRSK